MHHTNLTLIMHINHTWALSWANLPHFSNQLTFSLFQIGISSIPFPSQAANTSACPLLSADAQRAPTRSAHYPTCMGPPALCLNRPLNPEHWTPCFPSSRALLLHLTPLSSTSSACPLYQIICTKHVLELHLKKGKKPSRDPPFH